MSYSLLSRLGDVFVRFEERSEVHGLSAPDVSVDCPVECQFEGAPVEVSCDLSVTMLFRRCRAETHKTWFRAAIVRRIVGLTPENRVAVPLDGSVWRCRDVEACYSGFTASGGAEGGVR